MAQNALVVLKVSCVMAGDTIPASLCETEQGGTLCSGCQAPTRRCTACNLARGIADAKRGLCSGCLASDPAETLEHRGHAQLLEHASNTVLDLIDRMREEKPVANEVAGDEVSKRGRPRTTASAPEAKRLDSDLALQVLGEHGVNRPEGQFVPNPARVLALRFGLLPAEALSAVQELTDSGKLAAHSETVWRFLVDVSDSIRNRDEHLTPTGLPSRAAVAPQAARQPTATAKPKAGVKPPKATETDPQSVYRILMESSQVVDGHAIVRGAIPLLLSRLRIRTHQALETLERLMTSGRIRQVDEWRSICLLGAPEPVVQDVAPLQAETEQSAEPTAPAKTKLEPFTGIPARRVEPQKRRPKPTLPVTTEVPTPVDTQPREEQKITPKIAGGPTVSELFDAICRMTTDLGGDRLARAVVPTLSMRFSIGVPDIIAALERMENQKAIQRKDGWRSIVVLADHVVDDHPVKTVLPTARERAEKLNLRVVEGGEQGRPVQPEQKPSRPTMPEQPRAPKRPHSVSPGHSVSEELSELRRTVEELNRKVGDLAASSQRKTREPAPEPEMTPKLPKVQADQHELIWKDELWLTDETIAKRLGDLSASRYSVRQFHIKVAPLANGVRITHGLCSDGSIRTFYSSKDVLKILRKRVFDSSK